MMPTVESLEVQIHKYLETEYWRNNSFCPGKKTVTQTICPDNEQLVMIVFRLHFSLMKRNKLEAQLQFAVAFY